MASSDESGGVVLGPRTTVHAVVTAWPDLAAFLRGLDPAFGRLGAARGRVSWARTATLGDVALEMNVSWRRLVRDIAAEVRRETGRAPLTVDDPRELGAGDARLEELRDIAAELERGGSLLELAARLDAVTAGTDAREAESLASALAEAVSGGGSAGAVLSPAPAARWDVLDGLPEGHPVESLAREGAQLGVLDAALGAELERLGGSPTRSRWRAARPLVTRLVGGFDGLELRVRREREAWLPVLERRGEADAARLVRDRQDDVLEALRLVRLALAADDALSVLEHGSALHARLQELASCEDQVLVPVAQRTLTLHEWVEVRALEDAVGWSLIRPPRWPAA